MMRSAMEGAVEGSCSVMGFSTVAMRDWKKEERLDWGVRTVAWSGLGPDCFPWHFLNFLPEPHGQGSFLPVFSINLVLF